jgi:hypothetical protein
MNPKTKNLKDTHKKAGAALPRGEWELMTLDEWRDNKSCVDYAHEMIKTPMFRRWIGMLHNFASEPQSDADASLSLGRIEGMRLILRAMVASSIPINEAQNPDPYAEEINEEGII